MKDNPEDFTWATLRIADDTLDPEIVTEQLGIHPTRMYQSGEVRGRSRLPHKSGVWLLSTDEIVRTRNLDVHLDWILDQVEGKANVFEFFHQAGYEIYMYCLWASRGQGGIEISLRNLRRLALLNIELGIEITCMNEEDSDEVT